MWKLLSGASMAFLVVGAASAEPTISATAEKAPLEAPVAPRQGLQITSENGKSTALLSYGWEFTGASAGMGVLNAVTFQASAPLDEATSDGSQSSLDALAGATTLTFKFTRTAFSRAESQDEGGFARICDEVAASAHIASPSESTCSLTWVRENEPEADHGKGARAFDLLLSGDRPHASIWGVSGRAGSDTFGYIDPGTLAQRSVDRAGWSVKAFYAFIPFQKNAWLVTADVEHQDAYEARKEGTLCPGGGGACLTGPVGAPRRVLKDIVSVDARRDFGSFAASATLRYDTVSDVYAIEAPVYFARGSEGLLNGGIKFGWRSDDGEVTAAVFLGSTFSLGR